MQNKRINKLEDLHDRHVNYNGKNYIYSDMFTSNKGYILNNSDVDSYNFYASRFLIGVTAAILVYVFLKIIIPAIIIGLVIYIGLEIAFRVKFLKTKISIDNYTPPKKESYISTLTKSFSIKKMVLIILVGVSIAVLIPINIKQNHFTGLTLYLNYLILIGIVVYLVLIVIALINSLKNKEKEWKV